MTIFPERGIVRQGSKGQIWTVKKKLTSNGEQIFVSRKLSLSKSLQGSKPPGMNKKTIISCSLIVLCILTCSKGVNANDNCNSKKALAKSYRSEPNSRIDKNKFSSLCQFWINKLEKESGFTLTTFSRYILFSETHYLAIFQFDKLQFSCSYTISPPYQGVEEHTSSVQLNFSKKEGADQFVTSNLFSALKKKKTVVNILDSRTVLVDNYPYEKEDSFKDIYTGKTDDFSFNVRLAFDSVTQKALRQPVQGENLLAAYRDKGNRYFSGMGVIKNYETARDFYQKAWNIGDDTSGLYLGFLYLESPYESKLYNPSLARSYFDSVCLSGSPIGNYGIGWMYQVGYDGFPQDIKMAIQYFEKGADKNETCCLDHLWFLYAKANPEKAKDYYQRMLYLTGAQRYRCRPGVY